MKRGTFQFDVSIDGALMDAPSNVDTLRRLWLDRTMVDGNDLGPGNPGDFDRGAWHVACHVVAGGGVRRAVDGRLLWLEISHRPVDDRYYASVTVKAGARAEMHPIETAEGAALLAGSVLLGFVEGNSVGRVSARGVADRQDRFNGWRRQDFDQPVASGQDGGKVWEHWCTVRDIRVQDAIAASVLRAYVTLVAALGDLFAPTVARGRRDYAHPKQLCAFVKAGFTARASATWDTTPTAIPDAAERQFLEAQPQDALTAAETLAWDRAPRYYMFTRRIARWSPAASVERDLRAAGL